MAKLHPSVGRYKGSRKRIRELPLKGNWTPYMATCAGIAALTFVVVLYVGLTVDTGSPRNTPSASETRRPRDGTVLITEQGFEPATLKAPAGRRAHLTFLRTTEHTCATEITFPSLNIRKSLPLNQPVTVDAPMPASGALAFECGMKMLKGTVVAQ